MHFAYISKDFRRFDVAAANPFTLIVTHIHRGIEKLANGNVGVSDLQQAQPLGLRTLAKERRTALLQEEQGLCKHKPDAASCKDEDADEASGQLSNHDVYKPNADC